MSVVVSQLPFMLTFIYVLLAVCIGAVCGVGSAYMARSRRQGASRLKLWVVWALAITVVLICAAGMGTINVSARPSETMKFVSVAALALAFLGGFLYTRRTA